MLTRKHVLQAQRLMNDYAGSPDTPPTPAPTDAGEDIKALLKACVYTALNDDINPQYGSYAAACAAREAVLCRFTQLTRELESARKEWDEAIRDSYSWAGRAGFARGMLVGALTMLERKQYAELRAAIEKTLRELAAMAQSTPTTPGAG